MQGCLEITICQMSIPLTYVAVYGELDIGIVGPDDSIYASGEELPEQPEA